MVALVSWIGCQVGVACRHPSFRLGVRWYMKKRPPPKPVKRAETFLKGPVAPPSVNDATTLPPAEQHNATQAHPVFGGNLGRMVQEHGWPFLMYWVALWFGSAVLIWAALHFKWLTPGDAIDLLRKVHIDWVFNLDDISPNTANVALALVLNEGVEVFRFPFVMASFALFTKLARRAV
eukprot:GGOE01040910.1.p1 GENE.GGOE01040910.1~~GGOE01040910.1.p1  ORF type:complete len:178 (+),score=47.10 GGOE01040910.1:52-585(+)